MMVTLNIPTNYHIPLTQLSGIEKLQLVSKGEGKYLVELIWQGRDVAIEVYLKNKQLMPKKAQEIIEDNLSNLFANLVVSSEWNPDDKKVSLIWTEHMNEFAFLNHQTNNFVYRHMDKEMKDKFKKELRHMQKEKIHFEKLTRSPRPGSHLVPSSMTDIDQKMIRLRMALELDAKKLSGKRYSVDSMPVPKEEFSRRNSGM